jgi:tRNA threonylcarbamoyladenosine biosynthesis protein TsaB
MGEPWLLVETSGRGGQVGVAVGGEVVGRAALDPARRHARDLTPTAVARLADLGLTLKQLAGVMVGVGPGSYTGLRVGVMTAKAICYATGCRLVAVPTFAGIAAQSPPEAGVVDVLGDALKGQAYVERFTRTASGWVGDGLRIEAAADWAKRRPPAGWVSGPGLSLFDGLISADVNRVPEADRHPGLDALARVGAGLPPLTRAELFALEPLYLRGSSAEELAKGRGG